MTSILDTLKENEDFYRIVGVIDRSGSMRAIKDDAIGAFNQFLSDQKKVGGRASFTVCLFDDQYEMLHTDTDIDDVGELDDTTFVPRGMTALLDAMGRTIDAVQSEMKKSKQKPEGTIMFVITDGMENASKEYTHDQIKKMLAEVKEEGWEVVFLAADEDAINTAQSWGIPKGSTYHMGSSGEDYGSTMAMLSVGTTAYRAGQRDIDWTADD